jgi:aryl-alcohol dehydrogenase-like predicted oxidoreductase
MRYRPLGQSSIQASAVGFGAWAIGGWMWGGADEREAVRAIQAALDQGITLIDTAPAYGLGLSEELVGEAIAGRREKVVLATKCGLVWHTAGGRFFFNQGGKPVHRYLGGDSIRYELEQSLKRLRTDYVDLYQTHWQDSTTPIEETMTALVDLKRQGKIRAIGVSNASVEDIRQYQRLGPVDADQEKYSLLDRGQEAALVPYCREQGIAVLAYSPLANGLLTGKIGPEREFSGDDLRRNNPRFSVENRVRIQAMLEQIQPIAGVHGLTLGQLVIAWTLAQPGITHALVGARNPRQAIENAGAADAILSDEELAAIDEAFRQPIEC